MVCLNCNGKGKIEVSFKSSYTSIYNSVGAERIITCEKCKGAGKISKTTLMINLTEEYIKNLSKIIKSTKE